MRLVTLGSHERCEAELRCPQDFGSSISYALECINLLLTAAVQVKWQKQLASLSA
jgi:hypothetical protein